MTASKYAKEVMDVLGASQASVQWLTERLDGLETGGGTRNKLASALYDIVIEHHVGIIAAISTGATASAFALMRPIFEALVRGGYLQLIASEEEVQAVVGKGEFAGTPASLKSLEHHADFQHGLLGRVKADNWTAMHGFTHGGLEQISKRFKTSPTGEITIEPNYGSEEIIEVLKASGTFALMALRQIARISSSDALVVEISERLDAKTI